MNRFLNSTIAILTFVALSGCGGAGSASMPYTPGESHSQSLLPHAEYKFVFVNKTSANLEVTRSRDECMSTPPPQKFTVTERSSVDFRIDTKCLIDPSTFTLAFVSTDKSIDAVYTKETGNPWKVKVSDANGLKLDFDVKVVVVRGVAFDSYYTTVHLK